MIACQFQIGDIVWQFEGKTQKDFKSLILDIYMRIYFTPWFVKYQEMFVLNISPSFFAYLLVLNATFVVEWIIPHCYIASIGWEF